MEKNSKSHCHLDLDRTIPNVELVRAIYRAQRYTDTQTDSQTDRHEYSTVAVDKPQL